MKPKRIILIRHAESIGNKDKEIYSNLPDYAVLLTEKGVNQSFEVGKNLNNILKDESFCIYYSPYFRTRQTMDNALKYLNNNQCLFKREEPRIREQEYSGKLRAYDSKQQFDKEREEYGKFFYRMDGGESGADCSDRVSDFLSTLNRDFEKQNYPENVLIFTHGMLLRIFIMRFFHITVEEFEMWKNPKNGEIHILELGIDNKYKLITELRKHEKGYGYRYENKII